MRVPRRRALQALGGGLVGVAGCLGDPSGTATPSDTTGESPPQSETSAPTEPPTETPTEDRLDTDPGGGFRWAFDLGANAGAAPIFAPRQGLVLVAGGDGVVRALTPGGEVAWRYDAPKGVNGAGPGEPFVLLENTLFVVTGRNVGTGGQAYAVRALDPATGERRWTFDGGRDWLGVLGRAAGGVAIAEGDDALGSGGDRTFLIEFDGDSRWAAETGDATALADGGGRVYVASYGATRAFDADSGAERWQVDARTAYRGLAADGRALYTVEERPEADVYQTLVTREGETGERRWTSDWSVTSLHRHADAGVVAGGEHVVSYAPDGAERWRYDPGGSVYGPATGDTIFVGPGRDVAALDLTDGTERWRVAVDAPSAFPEAYGDGLLVTEYLDGGRYFAHDAATGEVRWSVDLDGSRQPGVAVGSANVYVVTNDGRLLARPR